MENDIIYFSDFPNLQETGTRKDNGKFDLTLLPTQELKEEFRGYIMYRCKNGTFRALIQDRTAYNHIAKFLNSRINRRIKSLGDRNPEKWISLLKGWMLEQGITIVKEECVWYSKLWRSSDDIIFQKRTEIFRARRFTG